MLNSLFNSLFKPSHVGFTCSLILMLEQRAIIKTEQKVIYNAGCLTDAVIVVKGEWWVVSILDIQTAGQDVVPRLPG